MKVGDRAETTRRYSEDDMARFAALAGDPGRSVTAVPEPLIGALFSYLLGVELPGFGTNYLKQDMRFVAPAPLNEDLVASVSVTRLRPEKHLVDLQTVCATADGVEICRGRALVLIKDVTGTTAASH